MKIIFCSKFSLSKILRPFLKILPVQGTITARSDTTVMCEVLYFTLALLRVKIKIEKIC